MEATIVALALMAPIVAMVMITTMTYAATDRFPPAVVIITTNPIVAIPIVRHARRIRTAETRST